MSVVARGQQNVATARASIHVTTSVLRGAYTHTARVALRRVVIVDALCASSAIMPLARQRNHGARCQQRRVAACYQQRSMSLLFAAAPRSAPDDYAIRRRHATAM